MIIVFFSQRFRRQYKKLSDEAKELFKTKGKIFEKDPFDLRLRTHKLHGDLKDCYAFSVNFEIRAVFEFVNKKIVHFHSIGNHGIYD